MTPVNRSSDNGAGSVMTRRLLRGGATAIVLLAVVDPAVPRARASRPLVTLAVAPGTSSALVDRVRAALDGADVAENVGGGDLTAIVGMPSPALLARVEGQAIAVLPDTAAPRVTIGGVESPGSIVLGETAEFTVRSEARGRPGDSLVVRLREGSTVVARETVALVAGAIAATVRYVPSAPGLAGLRVEAALVDSDGNERGETASWRDVAMMVSPERRMVLVHEGVPSWNATFVRRALERDPRLSVESRTRTSRGISTGAGAAPATLSDPTALRRYDAVVVGDPAALTGAEVVALERYVREGGSALLLLDRPAAGAAGRLIGTGWSLRQSPRPIRLGRPGASDTAAELRSASFVVPVGGRPGMVPLLVAQGGGASDASPVVWWSPLGAGTVVVSGAGDSWRYRDSISSRFTDAWPNTVSEVAGWSRQSHGVALEQRVLAPGAGARAAARFREPDRAAGADESILAGWIESVEGEDAGSAERTAVRTTVRVWPSSSSREATVRFAAPAVPGRYRLVVTRGGGVVDSARADAEFLVVEAAVPAESHGGVAGSGLVSSWAASRGGRLLRESELRSLPGIVTDVARPTVAQVPWHPMRSPWWMVPFALLLAAEWYLRRRAGLP